MSTNMGPFYNNLCFLLIWHDVLCMCVYCVDDSGHWGRGGLFTALELRSDQPKKQYELAGDMEGDTPLLFAKTGLTHAVSKQTFHNIISIQFTAHYAACKIIVHKTVSIDLIPIILMFKCLKVCGIRAIKLVITF